ncbi:MAG: HPr family phosphocarrier protein [Puniceicoccales bacterium]|jgi:phosphotransferase system HPr-like phosphotransfer protein|nr:HPr family phosphocarrier protein [Puniceicoccales bacterium]
MIITNITLAKDIDHATAFMLRKLSRNLIDTEITIHHYGKLANVNNLLNLLALAAKAGTSCQLIVSGASESRAIEQLVLVLAAHQTAPPRQSGRTNKTSPK